MDLSVVIPAYNEEATLRLLHSQLTAVLEASGLSYEIIVVDDGSTDGSFAILEDLYRKSPRLVVIRFRRNFGQTAAFAAGFAHSQGDVVVTMDADLQNDPADIPVLLSELAKGNDIVSGWRRDRKDELVARRLPSIAANRLISRVTGVRLHDYGCSLKAYRREVVKNLCLYGQLHRFIPALAGWMGVAIARRFGRSKYGLERTGRVILDLIAVRFFLGGSVSPIHVFGSLGLLSLLVGAVFGLTMALFSFAFHRSVAFGVLSLVVLPWLMGVQLVSLGLLGELVVRKDYETGGRRIYVEREVLSRP
jgi:glycosyltransferase involved in cell wall biosynthesis